jgi:putative tricarboxylic transport membrane protein
MKKYDQISSLVWMCIAILICVESFISFPLGSLNDPGPAFLPFWSGIILFVFSFVLYVQARIRTTDDVQELWYSAKRGKKLLFVLVVLFAYALFLDVLGFLLDTFLLLLILFRSIEPQRWVVSIGGSVIASILSYLVFDVWLSCQLPRGILGM